MTAGTWSNSILVERARRLFDLTDDRPWTAQANCKGVDSAVFFTERGEDVADAKAICAGCDVRRECREYAFAAPERFGVWGGMSERERRRARRARKAG